MDDYKYKICKGCYINKKVLTTNDLMILLTKEDLKDIENITKDDINLWAKYIEAIIVEMYKKLSNDLINQDRSVCKAEMDVKKELILLFEQVMCSLRYIMLGDKKIYEEIKDSLELLRQLSDIRNIDYELENLIKKYLDFYNTEKVNMPEVR